jgi:hypothetical protein
VFKLVAVGGKLRGKEFILNEGENIIGRSAECDHPIAVEGISKKHLLVTVNGDSIFAEDLGSANGTLVNGKIIKKMTLNDGDQIALPNLILRVVYVLEKKIIIKRKVLKNTDSDDSSYDELIQKEPMPQSLMAKPIWMFKYKFMPIVYGFNERYEWAALMGILMFVFICINVTLTILPVLRESKDLLMYEIALRAKQYAAEVDRLNNVYLRDKNLNLIRTDFLDREAEGVESYRLFDTEGRVYRPMQSLNTIANDPFSVDAQRFFQFEQNQDKPFAKDLGDNTIGIARAIKAHDKNLGRDVVVAIIAINFKPRTLTQAAANNSKAFLESLITSGMVAIIFFGILYYMTVRPLDEMKFQIERVLRGRQKELASNSMFRELHPLRSTINSVLSRIRELQNTDSNETQELEEDGPYVRSLYEFMQGAQGAVMILNSEKIIQNINPLAEDLLGGGIRESSAAGTSVMESLKEQGLAVTIIELCDNSANNDGCNYSENYEINGKEISVNVASLIGKDKFAKAFYVTFVQR